MDYLRSKQMVAHWPHYQIDKFIHMNANCESLVVLINEYYMIQFGP